MATHWLIKPAALKVCYLPLKCAALLLSSVGVMFAFRFY